MKKIISVLAMIALGLTMAGCSNNTDENNGSESSSAKMSAVQTLISVYDKAGIEVAPSIMLLDKEVTESLISTAPGGSTAENLELTNFVSSAQVEGLMTTDTNLTFVIELADESNVDSVLKNIENIKYDDICVTPMEETIYTAKNGSTVAYFVNIEPYMATEVRTGVAQGKNGEVKVDVTFVNNAISELEITQEETPEYYEKITNDENSFLDKFVWNNGTEGIDTVAGATVSSTAIIEAVNKAIAQESTVTIPDNVIDSERGLIIDNGPALVEAFESLDLSASNFTSDNGSLTYALNQYNALEATNKSKIAEVYLPFEPAADLTMLVSEDSTVDLNSIVKSSYGFSSVMQYPTTEGASPKNDLVFYVVETTNVEEVQTILNKAVEAGSIGKFMFENGTVTVDGNFVVLKNF